MHSASSRPVEVELVVVLLDVVPVEVELFVIARTVGERRAAADTDALFMPTRLVGFGFWRRAAQDASTMHKTGKNTIHLVKNFILVSPFSITLLYHSGQQK
jgi:hypothetical protein